MSEHIAYWHDQETKISEGSSKTDIQTCEMCSGLMWFFQEDILEKSNVTAVDYLSGVFQQKYTQQMLQLQQKKQDHPTLWLQNHALCESLLLQWLPLPYPQLLPESLLLKEVGRCHMPQLPQWLEVLKQTEDYVTAMYVPVTTPALKQVLHLIALLNPKSYCNNQTIKSTFARSCEENWTENYRTVKN